MKRNVWFKKLDSNLLSDQIPIPVSIPYQKYFPPECKSIGEWKAPLSYKSVPKEIMIYQQLIAEVKPSSVLIAYEGTLDAKSINVITRIEKI